MGRGGAPFFADPAYARSMVEGQPWQGPFVGGGRTFSFVLRDAASLGGPLIRPPFGDGATLGFGRAAIEGGNLGRNPAGVTDLLGVSLSTHDYVNHAFGPESRVSQDHLLRVDRALAAFFDYLDERIGLDKGVIALTADHGFMNAPEYSAANGLPAARLNASKLITDLPAALSPRFNTQGNLAPRLGYPAIPLDWDLIAKSNLNRAEVEAAAARFILDFPGIAAVFTRTRLESGTLPNTPLRAQVLKAWNREVSGDLYVVQQPYSLFGGLAVTHGSPYAYDTNVPVMLYGRRWIKAGKYPQAPAVADIAPTLAFLLDVRPPPASQGRVLGALLRPSRVSILGGPPH